VTGAATARALTSRFVVLVTAAVATVGWLVAPAGASAAADPCVGVVVDARLLGGEVGTGCAKGDPDSGLEALTMAGFSYAFAPRLPGFVCQIDGAPRCDRTGTRTYWSYWYRAEGSRTWVYSSAGAGARDPEPGSTEGWVWQDGGRREPPDVSLVDICPRLARERAEKRAPSQSPSPDRGPQGATAASTTAPRTTGSAAATSPLPATTSAAPSTASPTGTPTPTTTPTTGSPRTTPTPVTSSGDRGGSEAPWAGLVLGGGLVAALGAAAVARSRRPGGRP